MKSNLTIKQMQPEYRPDEKFIKYGAGALTAAELLAIILRTGSSEKTSLDLARDILYDERSGNEDVLKMLDLDLIELQKIRGVGLVKALQIKAAAELSGRICKSFKAESVDFNSAEKVADYYMEDMRHRKTEVILLVLLDSACQLIREIYMTSGTVNVSVFSPREIFMEALKYEAVQIIVLHNHPSGKPEPSQADIDATNVICRAGRILGIRVIDHIIIGDKVYYSLMEEGKINE